jgi:hypothetical protein
MSVDLYEIASGVDDERSFLIFLGALAADRADEVAKENVTSSSPYGPGANGWENGTIETFLESACAWARDSSAGLQFYAPPTNPWRRFADILIAGKHYE